ncbi:hypothetical protein [Chengkuizengella marina]|uniref:Uncharacterized protein n=1 Tax=Chengkuizengella marina TaxID=2507566 RepID=A0A6N9Q550_9BACL|nr:hypothetical protein [Chengkuizengella marina]NBI29968.1 hypothetical protein [Chengkuizengella marina]
MTLPNFPNFDPKITVDREKAIDLLLTSIAMEEVGLSHIVNAEGEKIQAVVESFKQSDHSDITNLVYINTNVADTLKRVIQKQILLDFKLDDVKELIEGLEGE